MIFEINPLLLKEGKYKKVKPTPFLLKFIYYILLGLILLNVITNFWVSYFYTSLSFSKIFLLFYTYLHITYIKK